MPNDLSQYTDEELEAMANGSDLSSYSDDDLMKMAGNKPQSPEQYTQMRDQAMAQAHPMMAGAEKFANRITDNPIVNPIEKTLTGKSAIEKYQEKPIGYPVTGNKFIDTLSMVNNMASEPIDAGIAMAKDAVLNPLSIVGAGVQGVKLGVQSIKESGKIASRLVNSLIRPTQKEYMFGKNPGLGIAKEGIVGNSLEDIQEQVNGRLNDLNLYVKNLRELPENAGKRVNLSSSVDPLLKTLDEFNKAPKSHASKIKELENIFDDLSNTGKNLNDLSVEDAYTIKGIIRDMQRWETKSNSDNMINSALKKMYHEVDSKIDEAIPELKEVNSRIADLISANTAIEHRVRMMNSQEPFTFMKLLDVPFGILKHPKVKTGLASILSEKYGIGGIKGLSQSKSAQAPIASSGRKIFSVTSTVPGTGRLWVDHIPADSLDDARNTVKSTGQKVIFVKEKEVK